MRGKTQAQEWGQLGVVRTLILASPHLVGVIFYTSFLTLASLHRAGVIFYTSFLKAHHGVILQQPHVHNNLLCVTSGDPWSLVPTSGPGSGGKLRTEFSTLGVVSYKSLLRSPLDSPRLEGRPIFLSTTQGFNRETLNRAFTLRWARCHLGTSGSTVPQSPSLLIIYQEQRGETGNNRRGWNKNPFPPATTFGHRCLYGTCLSATETAGHTFSQGLETSLLTGQQ